MALPNLFAQRNQAWLFLELKLQIKGFSFFFREKTWIFAQTFLMPNQPDLLPLKKLASQIRRDIVRMVHACQSGHPGGSLGCTDFFVALYFHFLKHNPKFNMNGTGEDLFFLSNGHISPVWYSTLARAGYFDVKELATFRMLNTRLQGHPATHEHLP